MRKKSRRKFSAKRIRSEEEMNNKRLKNLLNELYRAIDSSDINSIRDILMSDNSIINMDDGRGTPLQYACTVADNLDINVVKFLISHGANPYVVNLNGWRSSPEIKNFMKKYAIRQKLKPLVNKLIKKGRTPEYYDLLRKFIFEEFL